MCVSRIFKLVCRRTCARDTKSTACAQRSRAHLPTPRKRLPQHLVLARRRPAADPRTQRPAPAARGRARASLAQVNDLARGVDNGPPAVPGCAGEGRKHALVHARPLGRAELEPALWRQQRPRVRLDKQHRCAWHAERVFAARHDRLRRHLGDGVEAAREVEQSVFEKERGQLRKARVAQQRAETVEQVVEPGRAGGVGQLEEMEQLLRLVNRVAQRA
eukprot:6187832-Pleurochrysis_carterae.AAC.2